MGQHAAVSRKLGDQGICVSPFERTWCRQNADCAGLGGFRCRLDRWHGANHWDVHNGTRDLQGQRTGCIAGNHKPYNQVPWFWSDQYNIKLQIAGISQHHDRSVIRGSPEEEKFAVFYQKDKRLIAVDAINSPKEFVTGKKLIEMQAKIPLELMQDIDFDLKDIVS